MIKGVAIFCVAAHCVAGAALAGETWPSLRNAMRALPDDVVADQVRDTMIENGCSIKVTDFKESQAFFVDSLAKRLDVPAEAKSDLTGELRVLMDRGIAKMMKDQEFDIDFKTKIATVEGC